MHEVHSEYVQVGTLQMYCETQGHGPPLLLLHAGFATIETSFEKLRPVLAKRWTTIAVEQQGHGHTADIDRALTYEQMVKDTAALLRKKKITGASVFGWSDGGIVALGLAARHPKIVHKVATIGSGYNSEAETPEFKQRLAEMKPDNEHTLPFRDAYREVAPRPEEWPLLVEKVKAMYAGFKGWSEAEMRSLKAPLMVMLGDEDFLRPEHALELFRMVPSGTLAILPGSDHSAPVTRTDWVTAMLVDFFDAP
ncbi:alpha/beta fold hydrolase [Luteimonas sp. B3_2_R+30]|uniref:Alpha/beta fold hydrolase n=2 Tax=Luteimonas salinilitoris TaxID=3237697 RepID=A0ABV4HTK3_9GAMM